MTLAFILVAEGRRYIVFLQASQLLLELVQFLGQALQFQLRQNVALARHSDLVIKVLVSLRFSANLQVEQVHLPLYRLVFHGSVVLKQVSRCFDFVLNVILQRQHLAMEVDGLATRRLRHLFGEILMVHRIVDLVMDLLKVGTATLSVYGIEVAEVFSLSLDVGGEHLIFALIFRDNWPDGVLDALFAERVRIVARIV